MDTVFDVAIIGGGINGTAIAADASLRGLSTILFEKGDLASETSSKSTKLIHGGLRYLEYGKFCMVKKSLNERQLLGRLAPHLIHPCPFILPYEPNMRPFWILRLGLFLYDNLSRKNKLPKSITVTRKPNDSYFLPLKNQYIKGLKYYDCQTDDARLTLANALQAKAQGAIICTHAEVLNGMVSNHLWRLQVKSSNGQIKTYKARSVINASGPWVNKLNQQLSISNQYQLSLVKGSHIVIPKLYEGKHAYLLQNNDKRIIFALPYHNYTMVGTTDVQIAENKDKLSISAEEIAYLFQTISKYFNCHLKDTDIVDSWSGVRALLRVDGEAPQDLSREYCYSFSPKPAPALSIYSGKITTYRQLAEKAVNELQAVFPSLKKSLTEKTPLPGALLGNMSYHDYQIVAFKKYKWLDKKLLHRFLKSYGTNTEKLLAGCHTIADLGQHFEANLYQREVDYLCQHEWAVTSEDILWRRTKLGLNFSEAAISLLDTYLLSQQSG